MKDGTGALEGTAEGEASSGDMSRDAVLEGMKDFVLESSDEAKETEEVAEESEGESEESDEGEESEEDEGEEGSEDEESEDEDEEDEEPEGEAEEESEEESDDDLIDSKKLKALHAKEKRIKEAQDKRDKELRERERTIEETYRQYDAKIKSFESAQQNAKLDPVGFLEELGVFEDPEEYEAFAREAFDKSPKGKELGGKNRFQNRSEQKRRQQQSALEKANAKIEEMERKFEAERNKREQEALASQYLSKVEESFTDETPLFKSFFKEDRVEAEVRIFETASKIAKMTGEIPDASDVLLALEKQQVAMLKKLGIDPSTAVKKKKAKKKKTPDADEKRTAKKKTLTNVGTPTRPKGQALEGDELKQHVLANMPFGP